MRNVDALIIGGGVYGCALAERLKVKHGLKNVLVVERSGDLLTRASYVNQARVHNGYHYPRDFVTAYRSRVNQPQFLADFPEAVVTNFPKAYAIARHGSKVTAKQFQGFCKKIGASLKPAPASITRLFSNQTTEQAFIAIEPVFNAAVLRNVLAKKLAAAGVPVLLSAEVKTVSPGAGGSLVTGTGLPEEGITARLVLNCTYSGLGAIAGMRLPVGSLKHEITEMALIRPPEEMGGLGITVMDGPFFSCMPFPDRGLYTLSHVRFTPHNSWMEAGGENPYQTLDRNTKQSRADRMLRDAARFVPVLGNAEIVDSLFEVKTVLCRNEDNDGRPILFYPHPELPGAYSILGGKIDNIYDAFERLDSIPGLKSATS